MTNIPSTPKETLVLAREIAMKNGVRYAYTGDVHNEAGDSTYCHQCGAKIIGRDRYVLSDWKLTADEKCESCGTPCAGVFEAIHGNWGSKRLPVRLRDFAA